MDTLITALIIVYIIMLVMRRIAGRLPPPRQRPPGEGRRTPTGVEPVLPAEPFEAGRVETGPTDGPRRQVAPGEGVSLEWTERGPRRPSGEGVSLEWAGRPGVEGPPEEGGPRAREPRRLRSRKPAPRRVRRGPAWAPDDLEDWAAALVAAEVLGPPKALKRRRH